MRKNTLFLIFVSFVCLFISQALMMLLLFVFLDKKPESNNWGVLITDISFIGVIWLTLKFFDLKLKYRFRLPKPKIILYIILISICFVIIYPLIAFLNFTSDISRNIIEFTKFNFVINTNSIFYYFNIVFISPVLEEIYYRKIILYQIEKKYNAFWAVSISSILFSVFHMDYVQCQISFVFGLISGYLYLKTKRIEISILLHSFINILVTITSNSLLCFNEYYYLLAIYLLVALFGNVFISKVVNNVNKKYEIND